MSLNDKHPYLNLCLIAAFLAFSGGAFADDSPNQAPANQSTALSSPGNSSAAPELVQIKPKLTSLVSNLMLIDTFESFRKPINEKLEKGTFSPDDLEKLDFSFPDTPGFGAHPEFEVFNPKGFGQQPDRQPLLDRVTVHSNSRVIYNLRRTTAADGTVTDTLYRIIPDVTREACAEEAEHVGNIDTGEHSAPFVNLPPAFKLAPDNHNVVVDPSPIPWPVKSVCVQLADGKLYTFRWLTNRSKKPGETTWRIHQL
jgi:hypothetical protein